MATGMKKPTVLLSLSLLTLATTAMLVVYLLPTQFNMWKSEAVLTRANSLGEYFLFFFCYSLHCTGCGFTCCIKIAHSNALSGLACALTVHSGKPHTNFCVLGARYYCSVIVEA